MKILIMIITTLISSSVSAYDINMSAPLNASPPPAGVIQNGPIFALTYEQIMGITALRIGIRYRQEMNVEMNCLDPNAGAQSVVRDYVEGLELRVTNLTGPIVVSRYVHTDNSASSPGGSGFFQSVDSAISGTRGVTVIQGAELQALKNIALNNPGQPLLLQLFRVGIADIINGSSSCLVLPGTGLSGNGTMTVTATVNE